MAISKGTFAVSTIKLFFKIKFSFHNEAMEVDPDAANEEFLQHRTKWKVKLKERFSAMKSVDKLVQIFPSRKKETRLDLVENFFKEHHIGKNAQICRKIFKVIENQPIQDKIR